jgi:pimeloyl-ACP methyl ester carboxylesterase
MARFTSFDGIELHYEVEGAGPPVILLHGFAADAHGNWVQPGVVAALVAAGRQAVTLDARGHGQSGKPHEPDAYADDAMLRDVQALIDHLGFDHVDVAGYSMGSMITSRLVTRDPRVRSIVLGGVGAGLASGMPSGRASAIADALEAEDPATIADPTARGFRAFADSTGADRYALAAIQRAPRFTADPDLAAVAVPALVLTGDKDTLVGSPQRLADLIPGARVQVLSGDHLSAVADPAFPKAIVDFLAEVDGR